MIPLQLDNPLYHVYEGARERRQRRTGSISSNGMTKSQSTGELAKHNKDSGIVLNCIVVLFKCIL